MDVVTVFILPPTMAELQARLERRAEDPPEVIARRLANARVEIRRWPQYDYVLVNDDIQDTFDQLARHHPVRAFQGVARQGHDRPFRRRASGDARAFAALGQPGRPAQSPKKPMPSRPRPSDKPVPRTPPPPGRPGIRGPDRPSGPASTGVGGAKTGATRTAESTTCRWMMGGVMVRAGRGGWHRHAGGGGEHYGRPRRMCVKRSQDRRPSLGTRSYTARREDRSERTRGPSKPTPQPNFVRARASRKRGCNWRGVAVRAPWLGSRLL